MSEPTGLAIFSRPNVLQPIQPKSIPKSLVFIFVIAQFFFGIDCGFFATVTSKRLRVLAYFGSVLNVLIMITTIAYDFVYNSNYIDPVLIVKVLCVFFILHSSKYKLRNFLTDIMAIDDTCNVDLSGHIGLKTSLTVVYVCCYKFVMSGLFCVFIHCWEGRTIDLIMFISYETTHYLHAIVMIVNCVVFYTVYLRVKFLKFAFEHRKFSMNFFLIFFKSLADCLKKIRASEDALIVLRYITDCIICVSFIWNHLKWMKLFPDHINYGFISVETFNLMLFVCIPGVIAEMVAAEIDKMKLLIHERLLVETNREKTREMLDLLRYIEARPLTYKAWRLVPVDLRLPVSLLSMTATYVIVLAQLTHLF